MNMKKISAVILALVMVLSLTATAFAVGLAGDEIKGDGLSTDVTGQYTVGTDGADHDVYYVTVKWGAMQFTFKGPDDVDRTWDPTTHTWKDSSNNAVSGSWNNDTADNKVTVVNDSSLPVNVTFNTPIAESTANVTAGVYVTNTDSANVFTTKTLDSAVGTSVPANASAATGYGGPSVEAYVRLAGELPTNYTQSTKLFTLSISLTK